MATIVSTQFKLPQSVISNGEVTGALWLNPGNLLLSDDLTADSQASIAQASDIIVGNYNMNLPLDAVVTGIEIELFGYRGAQTVPPITVLPYFVDDTDGTKAFYPGIPITGLTETYDSYTVGGQNYTFNTSFTPEQINNSKIQLVANGAVFIDTVKLKVYYFIPTDAGGQVQSPVQGCPDCLSQIQTQQHFLGLPLLADDTSMILSDFNYADGNPVQILDLGDCGGYVDFVIDESVPKGNGARFEENVRSGYWEVLANGTVLVDFGVVMEYVNKVGVFQSQETVTGSISGASGILSYIGGADLIVSQVTGTFQIGDVLTGGTSLATVDITAVDTQGNRGLQFKTPYTNDLNLRSAHDANAKVIVSNNAPFYDRFIKKCHVDVFFSPPIDVEYNDADVVNPAHTFNFQGQGVIVTQDATDPFQANIFISGNGIVPPQIVDTVSTTSGNVQVSDITLPDLNVQGLNRGALVQIAMEETETVASVIGNGSEVFVQVVGAASGPNNIRTYQFFLANPTVGPMSIVVTLSGPSYISLGAEAVTGVDPVSPIGTVTTDQGTSNTPSTINSTTQDNSLIFDSLVTAMTPILHTAGPGQVINWTEVGIDTLRQGSSSAEPAGLAVDNVTMDYSITQNTAWAVTSLELKGITILPATLTIEDEGIVVDATTVNIDFVGAGVTATQTSPGNVQVEIPGGGGAALTIQDESINVDTATTLINFQGSAVSATSAGPGLVDVTIVAGAGTAVTIPVTQAAHGLTLGQVIKSTGANTYAPAQADSSANAEVVGIVTNVIGVNSFEFVTEGEVEGAFVPVQTEGTTAHLSTIVAGGFQSTAPVTVGQIDKPVATITESGNKMVFHSASRGRLLTSASASGGGAILNAIANEGIASGTPVGVDIDGTVARARRAFSTDGTNKPAIFSGSHEMLQMASIDTDKYILIYQTPTTGISIDLYAVVVTIDAATNDITYATPQFVASPAEDLDSAQVAKLDTDKFVITYVTNSGNNLYGIVGTVAGTTITLGVAQQLQAANTTISTVCQLDTNKFAYSTAGAGSGDAIGFATVAGTIITIVDSTTTTPAFFNDNDRMESIKIATDKFIIRRFDTSSLVVCTTIGATLVVGSATNTGSANSGGMTQGAIFSFVDNEFFVVGGTSAAYITISGTTRTIEDTVTYASVGGSTNSAFGVTDGTNVYAIGEQGESIRLDWSAPTLSLTLTSPIAEQGVVASRRGVASDGAGYIAITTGGEFTTNGMVRGFSGIANSTVAAGSPISVTVGGVATVPGPVSAGTVYEVLEGALNPIVTPTGIYEVTGASSTSVIV